MSLQHTSIENPAPVDHRWGVHFPRHIRRALQNAPTLTRGIPGHHVYLQGDIPAVWPKRCFGEAILLDAAVMTLLVAGGDIAADYIDSTNTLPDEVLDWIYEHEQSDIDAWNAMLEAEIRMHQAQIIIGNVPQAHSPAAACALELIIDCAETYLDVIYCEDEEDLRHEFENCGGNADYDNTLLLVSDLLVEENRTDEFLSDPNWRDRTESPLHPANWFHSFDPATNPWLEHR